MKRSGINRGTKALKAKTRIKPVSDKRRKHRASDKGKEDGKYMGKVVQEPCVICKTFGLPQLSPTTGHHPTHDRIQTNSDEGEIKYSGQRKAADVRLIPLCDGHHQGDFDTSKVAVHREPDKWKELYGNDYDYVEQTQIAILGKARCDSLSNG